MKLQVALDRMTVHEALHLAKKTAPYVDIFEVGTSLIKEFGLVSVQRFKTAFPMSLILADMKTIDEGAYEFEAVYKAGADIATVMAASSVPTIEACQSVANSLGRFMMIDVLEESSEKLKLLSSFETAVFCVHAPTDIEEHSLIDRFRIFKAQCPWAQTVAVAGGVGQEEIPYLKNAGCDIVIVGSAITKAEQPERTAKAFYEAVHQ